MGALVHTSPQVLSRGVMPNASAASVFSGRIGWAYRVSSFDAGSFVIAPINSGGLSQCPCSFGTSSLVGRSGQHLIAKNTPGSAHYFSLQPVEARAQLPTPDDKEHPTGSPQSLRDTLPPTPEVGNSGSNEKQPSLPYGLITGLASLGFVETAYLTWARLAGTTVTCPVGGSCTDVLDSSYATVFGVPLVFIGMFSYGAIGLLGGIGLSRRASDWEGQEKWFRWVLLGSTTSMVVASAYFMYILAAKLEGASCVYCVSSAILSLSLLLSTFLGFTWKDMRTIAGLQLAAAASVVLALSVAFDDANTAFARSQDMYIPPVEPEVLTVSSSREISLAKHLRSVGARMYGAFWCSHCYEQKQMFGREAMKYVDYVECYPDGYKKGMQIAKSCDAANIQGFPTWIIKGQTLSGEQDLQDLAKASGFDRSEF